MESRGNALVVSIGIAVCAVLVGGVLTFLVAAFPERSAAAGDSTDPAIASESARLV